MQKNCLCVLFLVGTRNTHSLCMNLSESSLFGFRFHFSWFHQVRGKIYLAKDVANHLLSDFGFFVFLTYGYIIYQTNKVNVIQNLKKKYSLFWF